jgi:hypothetical protein
MRWRFFFSRTRSGVDQRPNDGRAVALVRPAPLVDPCLSHDAPGAGPAEEHALSNADVAVAEARSPPP